MNSKLFQSFTPALIGAVTVAAVGIPQAAQAGTIEASSNVSFTNISLGLIDNDASGDGIDNLFLPNEALGYNGSFAQVDASGAINGIDPVDSTGPIGCNSTQIKTTDGGSEFPFSLAGGTINAGAQVNCSGMSSSASNFAEIELTAAPGDPTIVGNSQGEYTVFSGNFDATGGDVIDLEGLFEASLFADVQGWTPGDTKIASAEYEAQYTINRLINGTATEVFAGEILQASVQVINDEPSPETFETGLINIGDLADYTIGTGPLDDPTGGTYELRFAAVERVNGRVERKDVPEPASLLGLLAVGGALGFIKRRHRH